MSVPVSSIDSLKREHDVYDSRGRLINPKINQPLPSNGQTSPSTTVVEALAEATPATIVIPFLQRHAKIRTRVTNPPPPSSQGSAAPPASSTANVPPVRYGQPAMQVNNTPKPPPKQSPPPPPPAPAPKSSPPPAPKPKQTPMPIIVIKQQERPGYYRVRQGSTSLSNPMSSRIHSGSTEVVVKKRYVPEFYTPPKVVMSHPLIPVKDSLTNIVSLTIRSAAHVPHHYPKRKVQKPKLPPKKKAHKKAHKKVHKKKPAKKLTHKKKKKHGKPRHQAKPAVVFKPREHKKNPSKYVYVESRRSATSSPLSETHSYSTIKRIPAHSLSKKLIVVKTPA